jgi:YgiT-type zinc finger domain-containing protein
MATLKEKLAGLRCPRCGGDDTYELREIEYQVQVGGDTEAVMVMAGVCTSCGEQLLDSAATDKVARAVQQLKRGGEAAEREMPCPVCGHPMPDLKGGKATICPVCGFKDSCCY